MHANPATLRPAPPPRQALLLHRHSPPAMSHEADPKGNGLLAALSASDWQRWSQQLELVEMPFGQVLYDSGRSLDHVHFPTTSIVLSLIHI